MSTATISGKVIDLFNRRIFPAELLIKDGFIATITETSSAPDRYILPGFIDAHIHIESSMLVPTAFAPMAVVHGTVATVSDPHEIANVCGIRGVQYMIDNSKRSPFKFFFGAPSCVPATGFETAGAALDSTAVEALLNNPDIWYLSEMMNYPGVLRLDPEIMAKITAARRAGKPVDGHAPGLRGKDAAAYAAAGITTDHECYTLEEAQEKVTLGIHILIREGSAAKNFDALHPLLAMHPDRVMFCSDDKHPDELMLHHINDIVKRSLRKGYNLFDVLRAASVNPVLHYHIPVGLLRINDPADFIVVDNLENLSVLQTWINGALVAEQGTSFLPAIEVEPVNNFEALQLEEGAFAVKCHTDAPHIRVIEAIEGQLVTNCLTLPAKVADSYLVSDTDRDILKLAVINRYTPVPTVAIGFIRSFALKYGSLASTVSHDCHNIVAVGVDDASLCAAVNALIACKGGIAVAQNITEVQVLPLPVAGLMSTENGHTVANAYTRIDQLAKCMGTTLHAPFMTLSFMALLVIPALKLSDKGLFDGSRFAFTNLEV